MRQPVRILCTAAALLLLSACAGGETVDTASPLPTATAHVVLIDETEAPALPTPVPAEEAVADEAAETPAPVRYSPTTGRVIAPGMPYRPVLVVVGNAPEVRPQTGLMQADIIYEFPLDKKDNTTGFVAVYADQYPKQVGPVQDARIYFTALSQEWGGMFVFKGYPGEDERYPAYDETSIARPAQYNEATKAFFTQDRTVSNDPENTLFCLLREMTPALYGEDAEHVPERFTFRAGVSYEHGKAIDRVGLPFASADTEKVEFVYHADDNLLYRYEKNSKGLLAESKTLSAADENGRSYESEPLRVQNLIVQYVKYENLVPGYRNVVLTGTGNCDFFINGRYVSGHWSRKSLSDVTSYTLQDGSTLVLEPGTTWIALQAGIRDIRIRLAPTK